MYCVFMMSTRRGRTVKYLLIVSWNPIHRRIPYSSLIHPWILIISPLVLCVSGVICRRIRSGHVNLHTSLQPPALRCHPSLMSDDLWPSFAYGLDPNVICIGYYPMLLRFCSIPVISFTFAWPKPLVGTCTPQFDNLPYLQSRRNVHEWLLQKAVQARRLHVVISHGPYNHHLPLSHPTDD